MVKEIPRPLARVLHFEGREIKTLSFTPLEDFLRTVDDHAVESEVVETFMSYRNMYSPLIGSFYTRPNFVVSDGIVARIDVCGRVIDRDSTYVAYIATQPLPGNEKAKYFLQTSMKMAEFKNLVENLGLENVKFHFN